MNKDLISVIVPIYNVEKYLPKCVDSILNQTYKNLEIILVDDGSPDNSGKICDEYAKRDNRIKVIHKKNGGVSSARNIGLENITGEYIGFVDPDDYINKNMYEDMLYVIKNNNVDIVICNMIKVYDETKKINSLNTSKELLFVSSGNEKFNNLYNENSMLNSVVWNKLYKKRIFEKLTFPDGKIHEDEYIMHYLLDRANAIAYIKGAYYYYVQHNNSIMSTYSIKRLDSVYALENRMNFFKEYNMKSCEIKTMYSLCMNCIYNYINLNSKLYLEEKIKLKTRINEYYRILKKSKYLTFYEKLKLFFYRIFPKLYTKIVQSKSKE